MLSITYVSSATRLLDEQELEALLARIRPRNDALGVTGMLLYSGGNIIQVIEGPDDAVDGLYGAIATDPRHRQVLVLLREPIEERAFPDWSMGFRRFSEREVRSSGFTPFLQERPPGGAPSSTPTSTGSAQVLLETFRRSMR